MKKAFILLAFAFLLGNNSFAQGGGIQFSHGTWKELLAKADAENKLVFVDAYAEWCGPCKKMAKDVFTQQGVGEFYNAKFVNVKMDMEKGEGIGLAQQFGVMAYPTLLFVGSDGQVMHRGLGYHASDQFVELGEAALDPNRNLGGLKAKYDKGDRSPELLLNYATMKRDAMDDGYSKIAEEYLATQSDWSTEKNMEFVLQMAGELDSKQFDYILQHRKAFEEQFGEQAVAYKVEELVQREVSQAQTEADLKKVDALYAKTYPEKAAKMSARLKMGFHAQKEDWGSFAKATAAYYNQFPAENWEELNQAAWTFYELVDGKKNTKKALKWAQQSVKMESNYFNNDTVAALWFKLGKKKKALAAAEKAIAIAKKNGDDYGSTTELLEKIKAM